MKKKSRRWRLLGSSATKDVGKILLEHLDPAGKPLECYRLFLRNAVSFNTAQRVVSLMTQDLLEKFYCLKDPLQHPKYFNLFEASSVSKLEHCLNKHLVLLMADSKDSYRKIHDKRVFDCLSKNPPSREVLYFVLEHLETQKTWNLYEMSTEQDQKLYVQLQTELDFFKANTLKVARKEDCLVSVIASVLGRLLPAEHVHEPSCHSLRELVFSKKKAVIANEIGAEFYLASHLRSSPTARRYTKISPKNNLFGVHAIFDLRDDPASIGLADMDVVCVTENLRFYKLEEPFATAVKFPPARQRHPKKESFPAPGDRLNKHQQQQQRQRRLLQGKAQRLEEEEEEEEEAVHQADTCPCGGCKDYKKFEHNMSPNGPQQKFGCDLSTFDLFRLLGKWDEKVEADVLLCCNLSVASFDVESVATYVPDELGNEDVANLNVPTTSQFKLPRQATSIHQPVRIGFTDQARMLSGSPTLVFRHDPSDSSAMIGQFVESLFAHRDEAVTMKYEILHPYFEWLESYKRQHYSFFASRGWLPENYCQLWQNHHWETASPSGDQALDPEEEELLLELARELEGVGDEEDDDDISANSSSSSRAASPDVEEEEEEEVEEEDPNDERHISAQGLAGIAAAKKLIRDREARRVADVEKSWQFGIFGLLEARLRRLANQYNCYGFNSESFDLVILCSQLATYCKETNRKDITLHREGSRIRWMKIAGILLCEIKRLLSPGFSLSNLGEACQLDEVKFIFPFSQFVTLEFLDLPKLPADAKLWASDLNPSHSPSQSEVNVALAFFEDHNFKSIGEYLEWYLDLDVVILQRSVIAMAKVYYTILGLDIIDSRKLTVSSLASCGAQTWMARRCLPCQMFPNHQRAYSLLKRSLRGGLTTVCRSVSGKRSDLAGYVELLEKQMREGGDDGGPDVELCERVRASGLDLPSYISHCNAHLMPPGTTHEASSTVYLDINS